MTPTKFLIGQILVVLVIVTVGLRAPTQWAASVLAYRPELGPPWFELGRLPFYRPWSLLSWLFHYNAYARHASDNAGVFLGSARVSQQVGDRALGRPRDDHLFLGTTSTVSQRN